MTREEFVKSARAEMNKWGLHTWGLALVSNERRWLGLCDYNHTKLLFNATHIDTYPDNEVMDTVRHEIAHALCPEQGHNEVWRQKAMEIGSTGKTCSSFSLPSGVLDAIRSGHVVEIEEVEETVKVAKYKVTRLQDKCKQCGKVAVKVKESVINSDGPYNMAFITLECGHMEIKKIPKGTPFHTLVSNPDRADNPCKSFKEHQWLKNKCIKCGEFRPFPFQTEGMEFIESAISFNKGAICMDEMGLGKTIQALGVIKFHPELTPTVYIVKSKLKYQWFKQILIWLGNSHVAQIIQSSSDIIIPGLKSYIIGYDMLVPKTKNLKGGKTVNQGFSLDKFKGTGIKCFVLDECQQIKNPDSTRTQQVRKLVADTFWDEPVKVIELSGTPWKNRGSEFFCALNIIDPTRFWSFEGFKRAWVDYYYQGDKKKEGGIKNPEEFKRYIANIGIRRERKAVMPELPEVNRTKLYIKMTEAEEAIYDEEVGKFVSWYNTAVIGGEGLNSINILAKMSKMRHLIGLAKVPSTVEFVTDFIEESERKICIFTQHIDVADLIEDELKKTLECPIYRLSGSTRPDEVQGIQDNFNNTKCCVLVASTLAGGEGLNLQTGADCIFHERQWNPQNEEQAEGRFIRIGQEASHVEATYTQAEGSIDEHFDGLVERKRIQFHVAMNNGEAPQWNENDLIKDLAETVANHYRRKKAA